MTEVNNLEQILGVRFHNKSLLQQALTHSSVLNENPDLSLSSNERLEFLGDAVLNFIVGELIYREFPLLPEGELTKIRASLICRETLARLALSLELGRYLSLGQGEAKSGGYRKLSNLANTFEAILGAIFLDQGEGVAKKFVIKQLVPELERIKGQGITGNYKTLLQEYTQAEYRETPAYRIIKTTGPDHDRSFTIEVILKNQTLGTGTGKSRQAAEMEAAREAWERLQGRG